MKLVLKVLKEIGFKKSRPNVVPSIIPSTSTLASYPACHKPGPALLGQKQYSSEIFFMHYMIILRTVTASLRF